MPNAATDGVHDRDHTPRQPFQRRQVVRVASAAAATAFAAGYIVSDLDRAEMLAGLPRTAIAIAATVLFLWVSEIRIARHLSRIESRQVGFQGRIESRLEKAEYAAGYVDGIQRRPPGDDDGRHLHSV